MKNKSIAKERERNRENYREQEREKELERERERKIEREGEREREYNAWKVGAIQKGKTHYKERFGDSERVSRCLFKNPQVILWLQAVAGESRPVSFHFCPRYFVTDKHTICYQNTHYLFPIHTKSLPYTHKICFEYAQI